MTDMLLSPAFLFRYRVPCYHTSAVWSQGKLKLPRRCILPSFGELEDRKIFADLRAAWSVSGLFWQLRVSGKKKTCWCRATRPQDSDSLQVWIDTRDAHNIHRASRFCHRFAFLPLGGGNRMQQPVAMMLPIHRSRGQPKPVDPAVLKVYSEQRAGGYVLTAHVPAEALTGFDPREHPRLGFTYAVVDRELGWQPLSVGPEYPFQEDPSLWGTLELVSG